MKFFTTPNSKNIIVTLRIVTIEKSELTFLLLFYFYDFQNKSAHYLETLGGFHKNNATLLETSSALQITAGQRSMTVNK